MLISSKLGKSGKVSSALGSKSGKSGRSLFDSSEGDVGLSFCKFELSSSLVEGGGSIADGRGSGVPSLYGAIVGYAGADVVTTPGTGSSTDPTRPRLNSVLGRRPP